MPLKLRPTGLGAGIDKDRPDYTIYNSGWAVGRIYETRGGPDRLRPHLFDDTRRPLRRVRMMASLLARFFNGFRCWQTVVSCGSAAKRSPDLPLDAAARQSTVHP